jgi:hypothetical protein
VETAVRCFRNGREGRRAKIISNAWASADWREVSSLTGSLLFATVPLADLPSSPTAARDLTPHTSNTLRPYEDMLAMRLRNRKRVAPAAITAPETGPVRCECTALASGERQAQKGVIMVPSPPRRPRVLHSEGRDDCTTRDRSALQHQHPFDRRHSADCNVHRAALEERCLT